MPVLFDGETYSSDRLPRHYTVQYLLITTPLPLLVLAAIGAIAGAAAFLRDRASAVGRMGALTLCWLLAPLTLFVVLRPNVYGGIRHFIFVFPAIAILAGLGRRPHRPMASAG